MSKRPIAVLIAALVIGAPAGIAAITEPSTAVSPEATPAEAAPMQTTDAQASAETAVQPDVVAQAPAPVQAPSATEQVVTIPFTNIRMKLVSKTFPSSAMEFSSLRDPDDVYADSGPNMMLSGAAGPVFPSSAIEHSALRAADPYFDNATGMMFAEYDRPAAAPVSRMASAGNAPAPAMSSAADAQANSMYQLPAAPAATERPGT